MKKKFLSLLLALAMCLSLSVPAWANTNEVLSEKSTDNSILLSDGSVLIAEDLPNGDARFTIIKNEKIVAESYANRAQGTITSLDSRVSSDVHVLNAQSNRSITSIPSGYTYRGKITYNFYGGMSYVVGTRSLNVYYDHNFYENSRYNVNGVYQGIASLASYITMILSLPATVAASAAAGILSVLGIATGTLSIVIPDHYVRCYETEITWLAQISDVPDIYNTVTGSMFVFTQEGYESKTYYSGDYWPLSSYSNHDQNFAVKLYWTVLGQDILEIVSWS